MAKRCPPDQRGSFSLYSVCHTGKTEETLTAGTQRLLQTGIRSWLLLACLIQEERLDKNLKEKVNIVICCMDCDAAVFR